MFFWIENLAAALGVLSVWLMARQKPIAWPIGFFMVVLYAIELSLGLMNRYAPQLNLISISMSLKGVAAVGVWLVMLGTLVRTLIERVAELMPTILRQVQALL